MTKIRDDESERVRNVGSDYFTSRAASQRRVIPRQQRPLRTGMQPDITKSLAPGMSISQKHMNKIKNVHKNRGADYAQAHQAHDRARTHYKKAMQKRAVGYDRAQQNRVQSSAKKRLGLGY